MFCEYCGADQYEVVSWPHKCGSCGRVKYKNPIPVAIGMIPTTDGGLVLIKRKGGVASGLWAFPGGYMDISDTNYQCAASREIREETGLLIPESAWRMHSVATPPSKETLCMFIISSLAVEPEQIKDVPPNGETEQMRIIYPSEVVEGFELAFNLHTEALRGYYQLRSSATSESSDWFG